MENFLNPAIEIAKKAGKSLMNDYQNLSERDIYAKGSNELVTKADIKADKIIVNYLKEKFPKHNIESEEQNKIDKNSDYTWVVDPLDGTTNFIIQNPMFAVSIALIRANEIQLGVIYAPFLKELYTVTKDGKALLWDKPLSVAQNETVKDSVLLFCSGHKAMHKEKTIKIYQEFKLRAKSLKSFGVASLELAYVASGRADVIMLPGVPIWDVAAGILLVRQAGGKVTDFNNNDWTTRSRDVLATNGKVHENLMNDVEKIGL